MPSPRWSSSASMNKASPPPPQHKRLGRARPDHARPEVRFSGIPVSAGVAIGPVFRASEPTPEITRHKIQAADCAAEGARLDAAIAQSRKQLTKLRHRLSALPEESQAELTPLIEAYIRMLGSSRLIRAVRRRIDETLMSAESAVVAEAEAIAAAILAQAEPGMPAEDRASLTRRAEEVREIGRRLVRNLTRAPYRSFAGLPEGAVLISESLRPSDAALLDPSRLAGVATEEGGAEGHTAVMLRALGVPAVLGAVGVAHTIQAGRHGGDRWFGRHRDAEPSARNARHGKAGGHRVRARAPAPHQIPPPAGRDAGRRDGGIAGQSGAATRAAADRSVGCDRHRPAAHRVPVHEPRDDAGRGHPDGDLPRDRGSDGRRSGGDQGTRLGRREGHRGTVQRRHRAGRRRRKPGARPARNPASAAPAGAAGDAILRDSARRHRRAGAGDAAHGHHGRRSARGARHVRAGGAAAAPARRADPREAAAPWHHDRDARRRAVSRCAWRSSRISSPSAPTI